MKRLINTFERAPCYWIYFLLWHSREWHAVYAQGPAGHIHAGFRSIRVNEFLERGAYGPPRLQSHRWLQRIEIRQSNNSLFLFSRCVSVWSAVTWRHWPWSSPTVIYPARGGDKLSLALHVILKCLLCISWQYICRSAAIIFLNPFRAKWLTMHNPLSS